MLRVCILNCAEYGSSSLFYSSVTAQLLPESLRLLWCVVFALKVFLQSCVVSCHCGPQSTVVHSRVCHCSRGDLQCDMFLCFVNVSREIRQSWMNRSFLWDQEQELWSGSLVLSVPLDVSDGSVIFTGQVDVTSLWNYFFSTSWRYTEHGTHGCKMSIIHVSECEENQTSRDSTGSWLFFYTWWFFYRVNKPPVMICRRKIWIIPQVQWDRD